MHMSILNYNRINIVIIHPWNVYSFVMSPWLMLNCILLFDESYCNPSGNLKKKAIWRYKIFLNNYSSDFLIAYTKMDVIFKLCSGMVWQETGLDYLLVSSFNRTSSVYRDFFICVSVSVSRYRFKKQDILFSLFFFLYTTSWS